MPRVIDCPFCKRKAVVEYCFALFGAHQYDIIAIYGWTDHGHIGFCDALPYACKFKSVFNAVSYSIHGIFILHRPFPII